MLEGDRPDPEPSLGRRLDEVLGGQAGDGLTDDAEADAVLFGELVEPQSRRREPAPEEESVREALAGNLCRCTGYQKILDAVRLAATSDGNGNGR